MENKTLLEAPAVDWTPELRRVNNQFPTAIRSKNWLEIVRLANSGRIDSAMELASKGLRSQDIQHRTAVARRMRVERMSLFKRLTISEKDLRLLFSRFSTSIGNIIAKKADRMANVPFINGKIDDTIVELRREMNKWVRSVVRDSIRLGLKNSGEALLPIFKDNREACDLIEAELNNYELIELLEARLRVGLKVDFANRTKPTVKIASSKWSGISSKIMRNITRKSTIGLKLSERIWELTQRARQDLRRIVVTEIGKGSSPFVISKKVQKFLSPQAIARADLGATIAPGIYKSPFRNAMRVARTESNRAYTAASAEFAKDKPWIKGIQITLSPRHSNSDICDRWAGKIVSAERFQDLVPFHPHCMCFATYVLKDNVFEEGLLAA